MPLTNKQSRLSLLKIDTPVAENKPVLTQDGNFEVKESIAINVFIAMVVCTIFCTQIYHTLTSFIAGKLNYVALLFMAMFLLPIIVTIRKIFDRKPIILVNKQGVYIHNKLVTDWAHFVDAKYKKIQRRNHFKFILLVYYFKDDGEYYSMDTPLVNTQDKAEEEVVDAILYFYKLSKEGTGA